MARSIWPKTRSCSGVRLRFAILRPFSKVPASPRLAPVAWGVGGLIVATRIVLLAHWVTDVLAGLVMGALVERCLRPLSGGMHATQEEGAGRPSYAKAQQKTHG
ncbi:MAG: phosphatase PAP2 family protein [Pseudolabrys sp.]